MAKDRGLKIIYPCDISPPTVIERGGFSGELHFHFRRMPEDMGPTHRVAMLSGSAIEKAA